jgi:hypothetical protein
MLSWKGGEWKARVEEEASVYGYWVQRVHRMLSANCEVDPTCAPYPLALAAMCGKDCVAIASDLRFGINQQQTTAVDMKKIYKARPWTCM